MRLEKQTVTVTKSSEALPQYKRFSAAEMSVLKPASQPFQGTQTTDAGPPQGVDRRAPGASPVKE